MRLSLPLLASITLLGAACWRIGEPTESAAIVAWTAFPDTVVAGELFSFEFAGPVSGNACGRLDTAIVELGRGALHLSGRRSVYDTMCSDSPVSFYEARPLSIPSAGTYAVRADGAEFGSLVVVDSGSFSPMRARGEGTLAEAGGCLLFGPGWIGNQRPFALRGAAPGLRDQVDTGRRVHVRGVLAGFRLCGPFGSRPVIAVDTSWVTDRYADDYYERRDTAGE